MDFYCVLVYSQIVAPSSVLVTSFIAVMSEESDFTVETMSDGNDDVQEVDLTMKPSKIEDPDYVQGRPSTVKEERYIVGYDKEEGTGIMSAEEIKAWKGYYRHEGMDDKEMDEVKERLKNYFLYELNNKKKTEKPISNFVEFIESLTELFLAKDDHKEFIALHGVKYRWLLVRSKTLGPLTSLPYLKPKASGKPLSGKFMSVLESRYGHALNIV